MGFLASDYGYYMLFYFTGFFRSTETIGQHPLGLQPMAGFAL